ncbi:MAG: hypothetical protein JJT77_10715 [Crocinitomicaceae bacterium]|nr:hypothetical protein [Crocinitomicaceae bacterium]
MRVVLWIGNEPNQIALANKIAQEFTLVGIVLETKEPGVRPTLFSFRTLDKAFTRLFFGFVARTWEKLLLNYKKNFPNLPSVEVLHVKNINDDKTKLFTENLKADLICVSGTHLVRNKTLQTFSTHGIINLHTGLSPYVKGGPNCTNWCIANNSFELIGNTIMWIDAGIDTGNLILTEQTALRKTDSFFEIHQKVMEHAHELYLKAINNVLKGTAKSIPQNTIDKGVVFYSKQWNLYQHWRLYKHLNNLKSFKKIKHPIVVK